MAKMIPVPFKGGCITRIDRQLVPNGSFSLLENFRPLRPGFETRKGQTRQHTLGSSAVVRNLYQFRKQNGESHFYRQLDNGSVEEASNNPPTATSGVFGSTVVATQSNTLSAAFSNLLDRCIFSDGKRLKQYSGTSSLPLAFIVYKGNSTISRVPTEGDDYTKEVTDSNTSTYAVLDNLNTLAAYDCLFVMSPVKAKSLTFTIPTPNTNASILTLKYWNGNWNTVTITDNTVTSGISFGQTGSVTWSIPTDEIESYMFGATGYWYQLSFSSALSASVRVSAVTYDSDWQDITNMWNGVLVDAVEAQVYDVSRGNYLTYGSNAVGLERLATDDYVYFSTQDPISGFYMDVEATPNIVTATFTGSSDVSFFDGGTGDDYIKCPANKFLSSGFESGMSISITGTTSNNVTTKIMNVTSNTIYVATGILTAESNKSAIITFNVSPCALSEVATWTGSGFTAVTSLEDGTTGATKSGFVSWNRNSVSPSKSQFNQCGYYAYWYRFKFDKELSSKANCGIQTMPYYDISELGNPTCNASWKGRTVYGFDKYPYIYLSAQDEPSFLNGADFGLIEVGDGRNNKPLCAKAYFNELIVWQEERGVEGGCTTLIEGYSPKTFGRLVLSNQIGIMNSKCAVVVEGIQVDSSGVKAIKTIAFWLSRYGIVACDGVTLWVMSGDVGNYFDITKPECVRLGYEDKHWLGYDSTYHILRAGLVSGSTATEPNVFLNFDLVDKALSFDVVAQSLTCLTEVGAVSGNVNTLQMAGSTDSFVYQTNNGSLDNTTPIVPTAIMELDGGGRKLKLKGEYLRVKARSTGDIIRSLDLNCIDTFTKNSVVLPLQPAQIGEQYRRHRFTENVIADHLSVKWTSDNVSPNDNISLHDLGLEIYEFETGR